jgi:hypothetical protein
MTRYPTSSTPFHRKMSTPTHPTKNAVKATLRDSESLNVAFTDLQKCYNPEHCPADGPRMVLVSV